MDRGAPVSLLWKRDAKLDAVQEAVRRRLESGVEAVTRSKSLQASVKWACLRLRADLVSTMPIDVFREKPGGLMVEAAKPPVFTNPTAGDWDWTDWAFQTQWDLDDVGNCFGLITALDVNQRPARIEPVAAEKVSIRVKGDTVTYLVDGTAVPTERIWHERQFPVAGSVMGLSPTAYAALVLSGSLSATQFIADWFAGNAIPAAHLRNAEKVLNQKAAQETKELFEATVRTGDVFVTGKDWEYSILGAKASEAAFLDALKATAPDLTRFYGVPGDVVDVESSTGNITYANVTQRNLQLLTLNMGPTIIRRERAFTRRLVPRGQTVKLNTDAMLRMDPAARADALDKAITARRMTVTEARGLDNRPPLTAEQEAEFERLFPSRTQQPSKQGA